MRISGRKRSTCRKVNNCNGNEILESTFTAISLCKILLLKLKCQPRKITIYCNLFRKQLFRCSSIVTPIFVCCIFEKLMIFLKEMHMYSSTPAQPIVLLRNCGHADLEYLYTVSLAQKLTELINSAYFLACTWDQKRAS